MLPQIGKPESISSNVATFCPKDPTKNKKSTLSWLLNVKKVRDSAIKLHNPVGRDQNKPPFINNPLRGNNQTTQSKLTPLQQTSNGKPTVKSLCCLENACDNKTSLSKFTHTVTCHNDSNLNLINANRSMFDTSNIKNTKSCLHLGDKVRNNLVETIPQESTKNNEVNESNVVERVTKSASFLWKGYEAGPWVDDKQIPIEEVSQSSNPNEIEKLFKFKPTSKTLQLPVAHEEIRVPSRKIVPLKNIPVDPLVKFTGEPHVFCVGFKNSHRTASAHTENDRVLMHQVALMRLCEAYTQNMGKQYLFSLAKESIDTVIDSDDEFGEFCWTQDNKIDEDPNKQLWNWNKSLPFNKLMHKEYADEIGKETLRPSILQIREMESSLGPNDFDAKSDLSGLLMGDSGGSTDIEFDEREFIIAHEKHPFNDPLIIAGFSHRCKARDKWNKKNHKKRIDATESMFSEIESDVDIDAIMAQSVAQAGNFEEITAEKNETITQTTIDLSMKTDKSDKTEKQRKRKKRSTAKIIEKNNKTSVQSEQMKTKFFSRNTMDLLSDIPLENYKTGFEKVAIDWSKILVAANAPNPMCWMEALEAINDIDAASVNSTETNPDNHLEAYGLGKRFIAVAGGLDELNNLLLNTLENDQPKAELLLDCMIKNYVLQMPLAVGNSARLKELYTQTIVKNPILYKMVLRRRNILPQDLQQFVARIIETTESSDAMLAALQPSKQHIKQITTAAKEMFASGFLAGGPTCMFKITNQKTNPQHSTRYDEFTRTESDITASFESGEEREKVEAGRVFSYGSDLNYENAFNISLLNPCKNILEEVASHIPEFAYHIRPLFETRWENIGLDTLVEGMLPELGSLRTHRQIQMEQIKAKEVLTEYQLSEDADKIDRWCKSLVLRICRLVCCPDSTLPGSGIWMGLLACLHAVILWPPIGDYLICKMNFWLPSLLLTLHSRFASVREEGCCVLAFLVSSYQLFTRLHYYCRYLLVSNITFTLFDAMEQNPESYAFFHGVLGYMLHSIPCNAIIDCLLLWVPDVIKKPESSVARDWPRLIFYIARQWPSFSFKMNVLYERQILKLLETGLVRAQSKHNARLAIGHFVRRTKQLSTMYTCWIEKEDD